MLVLLLKVRKDKVVERKNNMSKYNLTDILNEYIGGGRIGTLKISYKDLVDKMDELEKSGKVIVREKGSSADGKVNREFEVVDRDSAVPGGRKQERGLLYMIINLDLIQVIKIILLKNMISVLVVMI